MRKRFGMILVVPVLILATLGLAVAEVDIEGSIRVRESVLLNHDFDSDRDDSNNFASMRSRIGLSTAVGEYASAFLQLQDSRVLGEPVSTTTSLEQVDMHQAYIHIHNAFNSALEFQIGRMEMGYGAHRQIGTLGWSDVGRSFDGVRAMWDIEDTGWVHFFAMKTKETGGILAGVNDGAGITQNPNGPTSETAFLGAYAHVDINETAGVEAYLLANTMDMGDLETTGGDTDDATGQLITAGGRAMWKTDEDADTSIKIVAEGAVQLGTAPGAIVNDEIVDGPDYSALAFTAEATVGLPTETPVYLGLGFDFASGDDGSDPTEVGTYQQLFPTGHGVLGIIDFVGWQNVSAISAMAKIKPTDQWKVWGEYHMFQVVEAADGWYNAGGNLVMTGAEEFDNALGSEIDLGVTFSPEESLSFTLNLAMWMPGDWQKQAMALAGGATDAVDAVANPAELDAATSAWFYTVLTF